MKKNRIILLGLILSTVILKAQTDFRSGFIIKDFEDTIYGSIDYRGDLLMSNLCKFKGLDNIIHEYSPNDIIAYRFTDSKYYVSKEINGSKVFLEYLIKGKINIYYMRDDTGDHYYLDKEDVQLTEIPYEEGIRHIENKNVLYQSTKHIGILNYYTKDAPELQNEVKTIKKPDHKNMIKLAEDYHNAICEGEKCVIYEKKQPITKLNLELVYGTVNFQSFGKLGIKDKNYIQSGMIAYFWLPRINEKLYFKTGFLYSQVEDTLGNKLIYTKIPTHVGYVAPNTYRIRPSFSIGLLSPSYSGGIAVKLNKRINIGIQSWVNFIPHEMLLLIPNKLYNYSILGNLYIEL